MSSERSDDEGGEAPCFAHLLEPDGTLGADATSAITHDGAPACERTEAGGASKSRTVVPTDEQ
jgi:hypothetical protein